MSKDPTSIFARKYRIGSMRPEVWDYTSPGAYFVTICTRDRLCVLGKIQNQTMHLSEIGKIVDQYWCEIPNHYPHVTLDVYAIMPNHFHGILILDRNNRRMYESVVETCYSTSHQKQNKFKSLPGTLGMIINRFKGRCTHQIQQTIDKDFAWQPRFHDHIIRDNDELTRIQKYIQENPLKWNEDALFLP